MTRQGSVRSIPNPPLDASDLADPLFAELTIESEEVPAPCLFLDVVQRQWSLPGLGPNPSGLDRRLYNMGMDFSKALLVPSVDAPVVALSVSSNLPGPPEDKRSEQLLVKVHQASAWAVKAASSSSFFDRASLLWLWQLQARLLISDTRSHQDINKIIASVEFSADATLNASRFAARVIGSATIVIAPLARGCQGQVALGFISLCWRAVVCQFPGAHRNRDQGQTKNFAQHVSTSGVTFYSLFSSICLQRFGQWLWSFSDRIAISIPPRIWPGQTEQAGAQVPNPMVLSR